VNNVLVTPFELREGRVTQRRVTQADVASAAGVSKTAVSFALNDPTGGHLSADTVERVRQVAAELGYRPNRTARSLRTSHSESIGFLSHDVTITRFAMGMISGALHEANLHEQTLLITERNVDSTPAGVDLASGHALSTLLDRQVDGLIVAEMGTRLVARPEIPAGMPLVFLNCLGPEEYPSILPEEDGGARAIVRALLASGDRRGIVIIGSHPDLETDPSLSVTIGDRLAAVRDELRAHGVDTWTEIPARHWTAEAGYALTSELLRRGDEVLGVIALNDRLAFGVYQACQEAQLRVGVDLSVVSFDDDEISTSLRPGLTTVALPYVEMGELAVRLLLDAERTPGVHRVRMPLRDRESVRRA